MTRFLCDEMMKGLARWLRAAGYDVALAPDGAPDAAVLRMAREEERILLTRDGSLPRQDRAVRLVTAPALDAIARELRDTLGVDWLRAPFTRCLVDNTPLRAGTPEEAATLPERARSLPGPVNTCPCCGRLYWEGSHVRRMRARLTAWQTGEPKRDAIGG